MTNEGNAFKEDGAQAGGVIGITGVRVGDDLMFALPAFNNRSEKKVEIKSVRVLKVAEGFDIVDYRTLGYDETEGMMAAWSGRTVPPDETDWLKRSHPGVEGLEIPAKSQGERYALVHVRVESTPSDSIEGVEVTYQQDGKIYRQKMAGEWVVEMEGEGPQPLP